MIQKRKLNEKDFRGEKFKNFKNNLQGNNDILNLSNEKLYMIFTQNFLMLVLILLKLILSIQQKLWADYGCENFSYELNFQEVKLQEK